MNIAVVAESPLHQRVVLNVLEKIRYEARAVDSGEDMLKLLDEENIDAVVLDKKLSDMNGYELARKIRDRPGPAYIPILMLGDAFTEDETMQAIEAGVNFFLLRPVHSQEMETKLKAMRKLRW